MRKFSSLFLTLCIGFGVIGCSRHPDPDPTIVTKVRLRVIADASQFFHLNYGSWPTGFAQFYPDQNTDHIAFIPSGGSTTNDAWGHPLVYKPFDASIGYGSVVSLGRDGRSELEERFR
jgi:hypothetical protein